MSRIESLLTSLEARLRLLVEGPITRDGFPRKMHLQLERGLLHVMKSNAGALNGQGTPPAKNLIAPDQYTLVLPAIDAQILLTHPAELDRLTTTLQISAGRAGISFMAPPLLRVVADPHSQSLLIMAEFCHPGEGESGTYPLGESSLNAGQSAVGRLPKAYLIVNGLMTYTIQTPIVNIGRDPANQLQLDDPRISRQHAQIRLVSGRLVIFDLDSLGGTRVNGVLVSSQPLNPGDVIQLAGLPLVYGEDSRTVPGHTQKLDSGPRPPEVL